VAGVRVHVLGTAQDGGVPHPGCACPRCDAARRDPRHRRLVASIAVEGATGKTLLVDAGPDFREQTDLLAKATGRPPPALDAVLVTHAHVGHYAGLVFLGREAMHARAMPLLGTARMLAFLRANRPWAHLFDRGEVAPREVAPGQPIELDGATVVPFASPHRAEDTDTLGLEVRGPRKTLVYVPDADRWAPDLAARIRAADVALVDGTFFDAKELPGRNLAEVPHPLVADSVKALAGARGDVAFTHLNHSNPLLGPDRNGTHPLPKGFRVLSDGESFDL
jgi:pyrroloquinoline quinone biosynthesis protein B